MSNESSGPEEPRGNEDEWPSADISSSSPYKPPAQLRPARRPPRRSRRRVSAPTVTRVGLLAALLLALVVVGLSWGVRAWMVGPASADGTPPLSVASPGDRLAAASGSQASALSDRRSAPGDPETDDRLSEQDGRSADQRSSGDLASGQHGARGAAAIDLVDRQMAPTEGPARIALVIDDLGRSVAMTKRLLALEIPMSFAVLPFEVYTTEVTATLRSAGAEILVHLPMQGLASADPGPGALLPGMSEAELRAATEKALAAVEGAIGVNNHMGSVLSADTPAMHTILSVVSQEGKFFLDSRTTADSVGFSMARAMGMPAAERQVFLDGDRDQEKIRVQFHRALDIARERGFAVAIGHPYPSTLEVLEQELESARMNGFEFVKVSSVLEWDEPPPTLDSEGDDTHSAARERVSGR